jgi:hypothetical protein
MQRTEDHKSYPEIELSIKLSQLEGAFKFLDHLNNQSTDAPRNVTERETVKRNLERVQECRQLYKQVINKHRIEHDPVPAVQIQKCV